MYLIFDCETTGFPKNWNSPITDFENWPRVVQLAWQIHDVAGKLLEVKNFIIKPEGYSIPYNSQEIHGISTERANSDGVSLDKVLDEFVIDLKNVSFLIGHNVSFDNNVLGCEFLRKNRENVLAKIQSIDTKELSTDFCQITGGRGGKFKWPKLSELYFKLFDENFSEAHNASADVEATARCFLELIRIKVIPSKIVGMLENDFLNFQNSNPNTFQLIGLNIQPYKEINTDSNQQKVEEALDENILINENDSSKDIINSSDLVFGHLHLHSQYSVLQATANIQSIVDKAADYKMSAVSITDHTNMFGAFKFINTVLNHPINDSLPLDNLKLKPILGCELNVCSSHTDKSVKDNGAQIPFLAKNKIGYHNLSKLSSLGFINGFYYVPRVDKELILKYSNGLIALTGSLYGEIPNLILNIGEEQAEEEFKWWVENFKDDFYVELNRHGLDKENHVNSVLLRFAEKYNVKIVASNNVYYLDKEDSNSHDILLCVKDGEQQSTKIGKGRGLRHGFENNEYYFKSIDEMNALFKDLPSAMLNLEDLIKKIEVFDLARDVLLPEFDIPEEFKDDKDNEDGGKRGENAYLKFLTYEGAKKSDTSK